MSVSARRWGPVTLVGSSLLSSCALFGYDFDAYGPAPTARPASGGVNADPSENQAGEGGRRALRPEIAGVGGQAEGELGGADQGGESAAGCRALSCEAESKQCGAATDGCGRPLDCGQCFWWFEVCSQNRCIIAQ
jgi:hypothetical protein